MDKRASQHHQGTSLQARVVLGGPAHGTAQAVKPGVDRARRHRRPARLQQHLDLGTASGRRTASHPRAARRVAQRARHVNAQLATHDVLTHRDLPHRGSFIASSRQASHEQLMIALVQHVAGHRPRREGRRLGEPPLGEQGDGALPQAALQSCRQPRLLDDQPGLEQRCGGDTEPIQQRTIHRQQRDGRAVSNRQHIDLDRIETEHHGVTSQRGRIPDRAAQLGERPSKGPHRIVGLTEEQLGKMTTRHRPLHQRHIGQHRPRLAITLTLIIGIERPPQSWNRSWSAAQNEALAASGGGICLVVDGASHRSFTDAPLFLPPLPSLIGSGGRDHGPTVTARATVVFLDAVLSDGHTPATPPIGLDDLGVPRPRCGIGQT